VTDGLCFYTSTKIIDKLEKYKAETYEICARIARALLRAVLFFQLVLSLKHLFFSRLSG
jgi:hypothetical protein